MRAILIASHLSDESLPEPDPSLVDDGSAQAVSVVGEPDAVRFAGSRPFPSGVVLDVLCPG